jgi:hypothetical protein
MRRPPVRLIRVGCWAIGPFEDHLADSEWLQCILGRNFDVGMAGFETVIELDIVVATVRHDYDVFIY